MKIWNNNKNIYYNRKIIFPVIFIFGSILLLFNDMGLVKWYQLKKELGHIQEEIDRLIIKEKELTAEFERLENNDEYIKKIARERFHMVMPGEKVFRVVDRRQVVRDK